MFDEKIYNHLRDHHLFELNKETGNPDRVIDDIREYLDSVGYIMPKAKYIYDEKDKSTWKFLHSNIENIKKKKNIRYVSVYNPEYMYGEL